LFAVSRWRPAASATAAVFVPSADVEMRGEEREQVQAGEQLLVALDRRVDEHARLMRVGDDLLDDAIAAVAGGAGDAHAERTIAERLEPGHVVAPLVVEERLAVGHEVLQVADLRAVDGGIVDLVQDAGGYGEPHRAAGRVRRADRVLRALRPARGDAGGAEGASDRRGRRPRSAVQLGRGGRVDEPGERAVLRRDRLRRKRIRLRRTLEHALQHRRLLRPEDEEQDLRGGVQDRRGSA
jgi:hypothetical protein